jgi:hypothetical protein
MTIWGVGVGEGEGEGEGEGLGDTAAVVPRACRPAWAAPQAVKAKARIGTNIPMPGTRITPRGFYGLARW